jgi:hypothetical protein
MIWMITTLSSSPRMNADLLTLFHDAQRCGAVVQTSAASDTFIAWHHAEHEALSRYIAVCIISPTEAINIFCAKEGTGKQRDRLLSHRLAHKYRITSKAVRDIWNLRTWSRSTRPYWTALDVAHFASAARKRLSKNRRPTFSASPVPAVAVEEVAVEPTPSQNAVPASGDVAGGYTVQSLQDEQEVLRNAVNETRAPSTVFAGSPSLFDASAWLVDSAIVAKEFEEIFLAWHNSSARRDCRGI